MPKIPVVGEVWQDGDLRTVRFVRVISVNLDDARIRNCLPDGTLIGNRITDAKLQRFNGTKKGYIYHGNSNLPTSGPGKPVEGVQERERKAERPGRRLSEKEIDEIVAGEAKKGCEGTR